MLSLLFAFTTVSACQDDWTQCGGVGYSGSTECCEGSHCAYENDWWSMCEPGTGDASASSSESSESESSESESSESESSEDSTEYTTDSSVGAHLWTTATKGEGTYYGAGNQVTSGSVQSSAHCSFSNTIGLPALSVDNFVAMGISNSYDGSVACGMCIEYQSLDDDSTLGSGTAMVVDSCVGCSAGDIDFALDGTGRYQMSWKAIDCPVEESKFQYSFAYSSTWYLKLQIRNHKVPVAKVELKKDGVYQEMKHVMDGHFVAGSDFTPTNLPPPYALPLELRFTSVFNEQVEDIIYLTEAELAATGYTTPITSSSAQFAQGSSANSVQRRLGGF